MKTVYVVEYVYHNLNNEVVKHINQDGFATLKEAQKWSSRNGARKVNDFTYTWVENGDSWYLIHPITVEGL